VLPVTYGLDLYVFIYISCYGELNISLLDILNGNILVFTYIVAPYKIFDARVFSVMVLQLANKDPNYWQT
jgi:hypothetical protein